MNVRVARSVAVLLLLNSSLASAGAKVRLAAPGLTLLNLSKQEGEFFSDHFAQQLTLEGFQVVTPAEIATLIGLERQKAMLGCGDSSCMVELANALGVDAVVNASLGKFDGHYQLNVKILSAKDASSLSAVSMRVDGDTALLNAMSSIAAWLKPRVARRLKNPSDPLADLPATPGGTSGGSSGAPGTAYQTSITNNLIADFGPAPNLEVEHGIGPHLSFIGSAEYLINRGYHFTFQPSTYTGLGLGGGVRWYPWSPAVSGFYLGAEARLRFLVDDLFTGVVAIGPVINLGYTFQFGHFVVAAGFGGGMDYLARGDESVYPSGIAFYLDSRLAIGASF